MAKLFANTAVFPPANWERDGGPKTDDPKGLKWYRDGDDLYIYFKDADPRSVVRGYGGASIPTFGWKYSHLHLKIKEGQGLVEDTAGSKRKGNIWTITLAIMTVRLGDFDKPDPKIDGTNFHRFLTLDKYGFTDKATMKVEVDGAITWWGKEDGGVAYQDSPLTKNKFEEITKAGSLGTYVDEWASLLQQVWDAIQVKEASTW